MVGASQKQRIQKRNTRRRKLNLPLAAPNEYRYAVAVRDGQNLWLAVWVKCEFPEVFVFVAGRDPFPQQGTTTFDDVTKLLPLDIHTSYHVDDSLHIKSDDYKPVSANRLVPLSEFRGTARIFSFVGYDPKGAGIIWNPAQFSDVIEIPPNLLGPRHGYVEVDLVEPNNEPAPSLGEVFEQRVFRDTDPWIVITIGSAN